MRQTGCPGRIVAYRQIRNGLLLLLNIKYSLNDKHLFEEKDLNRKKRSLSRRVLLSTLLGSIVLGLVALAIGLGLYVFALVYEMISQVFHLSQNTKAIMQEIVDIEDLTSQVMETCRDMSGRETSAIVYIADPDPGSPLKTGDWEPVKPEGLEHFLNWYG